MIRTIILFVALFICLPAGAEPVVISVKPGNGSANRLLMEALEQAARVKDRPVTITLALGNYYFSRPESIREIYYVSNTASEEENPDPTKHIALLLKGLKDVTIDGNGSTLFMTGEMTGFVIDACENITFQNIGFDYLHPTQTEIKVLEEGEDHLTVRVHPDSQYRIINDRLEWYGDGWSFTEGIAQAYDYEKDITWRTRSPMSGINQAVELEKDILRLHYTGKPSAGGVGLVYQLRDGIRDEVCGFVHKSKNVRFENVRFYYLGNFGVVCQYSEDITFDNAWFAPEPGSGRTNAGFADFIQVSGCKGLIDITNSHFAGAHDDPINVHGTHLKVMDYPSSHQIRVRFMHPQSYGFEAFFVNDSIEFIDGHSLLPVDEAIVRKAEKIDNRDILLTLDRNIPAGLQAYDDLVVENVTWTPEVKITGNYFSRIPTRGILVTTRRGVLIEDNTFFRMQMSGILIANDALSWYESGMARDVTIRNNHFIECGSPVIFIEPENRTHQGAVHQNIRIENNRFRLGKGTGEIIRAKSVDGLIVRNNLFLFDDPVVRSLEGKIVTKDSQNVVIEGNTVGQ